MNRRTIFWIERDGFPLAAEAGHYVSQGAHSCSNRRKESSRERKICTDSAPLKEEVTNVRIHGSSLELTSSRCG